MSDVSHRGGSGTGYVPPSYREEISTLTAALAAETARAIAIETSLGARVTVLEATPDQVTQDEFDDTVDVINGRLTTLEEVVTSGYWFNVMDYGAFGDGLTDDSVAIRLAIAACVAVDGGTVYFPPGTYIVSEAVGTNCCLILSSNVWLRGAGKYISTLKMKTGTDPSVSILAPGTTRAGAAGAASSGVTVTDMTLDGNTAGQSVEVQLQRSGIFAENTEGLRVHRVCAQNFAGDGIYIGTQANYTQMTDTLCQLNDRNGCTLANGGQHNFDAYGCTFIENDAQAFDCESIGGITENVNLTNCRFGSPSGSGSYVLTIWGDSQTNKGKNWVVSGCQIDGPIYVVWCDDVTIRDCWGTNPTGTAWVDLRRNCNRVTIENNRILMTQTSANDVSGISIEAVSNAVPETHQPLDIFIRNNKITMSHDESFAIYVGGGENVHVVKNLCIGPGVSTATYAGIRIRATQDMRYCRVVGNICRNIGKDGVQISGNQPFGTYGFTATAGDVVTTTQVSTAYFTAATDDILTTTTSGGVTTTNAFETGHGPLNLATTGTLPAGLSAATDYYWIKLTTSTGKLATSYANAMAGTPVVDITDTGTGGAGAHSLKMQVGTLAQTWETGHGPLTLATTGTLPAGLAASTSYWWIKLTTTTGYLATSYANAMAGTAIDITDTGSGGTVAHSLAMSFGIDYLEVHDNHSEDTAASPTMTSGIYLESGLGPCRYISLRGNTVDGIATAIANYPLNNIVQTGGNRGGTCEFTGTGVPGFPAAIGSRYNRMDGGAGTTTYVNETGLYSGWVAV